MNWRKLLQADEVSPIDAWTPAAPHPFASFADESMQSGISPASPEFDPSVDDQLSGNDSADGHDANNNRESCSQPAQFSETTNIYAKHAKAGQVLHENSGGLDFQAVSQTREQCAAADILNRRGVRLMRLDGVFAIGVWSDLDGIEIRQALRSLKMDSLPVRYLDGAGIPPHYKVRSVDGEPGPMSVLQAMEQNPEKPWRMRDCMLKDLGVMSAKSKYSAATY